MNMTDGFNERESPVMLHADFTAGSGSNYIASEVLTSYKSSAPQSPNSEELRQQQASN